MKQFIFKFKCGKAWILSALPLIALLTLFSCVRETQLYPEVNGDEALVTLSLNVPAATRSMTLAQESSAKNIQVLAFETTGTNDLAYTAKSSNATTEGQTTFGVNMRKGDWNLVVLANCVDVPLGDFIGQSQSVVLAALSKGITEGTGWQTSALSSSGIPMSSVILEDQSIDEGTTISDIKLYRAVARVNIAVTDEALTVGKEFQLRSVRVYNYQSKTKLCPILNSGTTQYEAASGSARFGGRDATPALSYLKTAYSTDSDAGGIPTVIGFGDYYCNNIIYLNPAAKGSTAGSADNTCLVIGGVYYGDRTAGESGGEKITYYRVDFSTNTGGTASYFDIVRNHRYEFNITRVGGSGEESEEDAFDRGPANMTVEVVPWNEDIIDIVVDGSYGLGVSQRSYTLYADAETNVINVGDDNYLKISTNYTNSWTISCADDENDPSGKWLSVHVDETGSTSHTLSGAASTSAPLSKDVFILLTKNETNGLREGWITITAGNLVQKIYVFQRGTSKHTLSVTPSTMNFAATGATAQTFTVTSNTTWSMSTSDVRLVPVLSTGTVGVAGTATYSLTMDDNGSTPYTGTITIITTSGDPVKVATITVSQEGQSGSLSASPTAKTIEGSASTGNTIAITANVAWSAEVTSGDTWLTITSGANGVNNGTITYSALQNTSTTDTRVATITVTGAGVSPVVITITQKASSPGGSADIIFFEGTGANTKLVVGKMGEGGLIRNNMAFFQFGSVVGFTNNNDAWSNSHVKFNPVTPGGTYAYASIPRYNNDVPAAIGVEGYITDTWHTAARAKTGKGDPCKLVGLTAQQVKDMSEADINAYNSGWRLPTANENVDFVGAPSAWHDLATNPNLSNSSAAYWAPSPAGVSPTVNGGWFPIPGNRDAVAGRTKRQTDPDGFLAAAGCRYESSGTNSNVNGSGYYWSSTPWSTTDGGLMVFTSSVLWPRQNAKFVSGAAARCVRE